MQCGGKGFSDSTTTKLSKTLRRRQKRRQQAKAQVVAKALPTRLKLMRSKLHPSVCVVRDSRVAVAKLLVELLEDHSFSQVLCRTVKASCFQRAYSSHVQLEPCGGNVSPSVIQCVHIRRYPGLRSNCNDELSCFAPTNSYTVQCGCLRLLQAQQLSAF